MFIIKRAVALFTFLIVNLKLFELAKWDKLHGQFTFLIVNLKRGGLQIMTAAVGLFTFLIVNLKRRLPLGLVSCSSDLHSL